MASFIAHGLFGAGVSGAGTRLLGGKKTVIIGITVAGFLFGIAPDAADWIAWFLFGAERWQLYNLMHFGWLSYALAWVTPYGLHLALDLIFHASGANWWPRLWWLEVLMWIVGGLMIWYALSKKEQT
jgi:hypothetical protein